MSTDTPRAAIACARYSRCIQKSGERSFGISPTMRNVSATGHTVLCRAISCPIRQPYFSIVCRPTSAPSRWLRKRSSAAGSMW